MKSALEGKVDALNSIKESQLTLKLNHSLSTPDSPKIYQVVNDTFTAKLFEFDVLKVIDGKTKYIAESNCLIQSRRYLLQGHPYKVDIFDGDDNVEMYTYVKDGKQFYLTFYYFTDKFKAIEKLVDENYKILIKDISHRPI